MTTQAKTSRFFDAYAVDFDAIYGTPDTPFHRLVNRYLRASMRLRFEKTMAGCDPIEGRSAIDIGCGPGHYAVALARRGAARVVGLDFAEGMHDIARRHAETAGVADRCSFELGDFLEYESNGRFDYAVIMGVMDYIEDPRGMIDRVLALTSSKAFFSFPAAGGFLAWQRRVRYRRRCDLFLYTGEQLEKLFDGRTARIERIARDFFVTVTADDP